MFALAVAFLLEIAAFAAFASLGTLLPGHTWLHILISVILFALLTVFWSIYMAPKAIKKVHPLAYYLWKLPIYGSAATAIFVHLGNTWGIVFVVLTVLDEAALFRHNLSRPDR